ncbi:MAG: MTH865 family protein [Methanospirillum sp.]|uniref:MTH865 family protein n=1 Tax=Methanospirillum sp. TaxID=45200 RepID=UPI00236951D1|nr:MTH865 family protein [Methanospirillum sp.]MDD1728711.1 MTH865 family protein [Methanospirillum sp.]
MREELITHWTGALAGVSFPVTSKEAVYAGLPKGSDGNMTVGGLVVCNVGELFEKFLSPSDFPINSAEDLVSLIFDRAGI